MVGPQFGPGALPRDKLDKSGRIGEAIILEVDPGALGAGLQPDDAGGTAGYLDGDDRQQMFDLLGQRAKTINQFDPEGFDLLAVCQVAEPPVKRHPQIQIGHITFGDHHRQSQTKLRRPVVAGQHRSLAALRFGHRFFEHLLI